LVAMSLQGSCKSSPVVRDQLAAAYRN